MATTSTHRPDRTSRYVAFASRALPAYLRVFGACAFAFGAMILAVAGLGLPAPSPLEHVFRWSHHPAEFPPAAMLGAIYVAWGAFIWRAANDPTADRSLIDFTIVGNAAHGAIMIYMALSMPGMREHLYTDTLLLELGVPTLMALWLPIRREARL